MKAKIPPVDTRAEKLNLSTRSIDGYELLDSSSDTSEPKPIGKGGSGIVYKAKQRLYKSAYVDRAVKFFLYEDEILEKHPEKKPISEDDFISEIANITTFNHQALIRVIDAGFHECDAGKIPYIVSDFIEGTTLKNVIQPTNDRDASIQTRFLDDPNLILDFLLEVAYAIKHIHDQNYAHCDIAPKNIFIDCSGPSIRPILGDLGISKPLKSSSKSKTRIIGSKKWMPEKAANLYDQSVDYEVFESLQPHWDIYSFAKTGIVLLDIFNDKKPKSWFDSLRNDLESVCSEDSNHSIDDLIERLEFLKPIHREVARVQELSMGVGSGRRKMMPIEALTTTKRLHDFIRHPAILRLAYVPQLTTANQILPGANHTRYEHTLGVIETMRRYLLSLLDESEFLLHLSTKKIEVAILAAALSCATRFPLSNIIHEIRDKDKSLFQDFTKNSLYMEVLRIENATGLPLKDYIRQEFPDVQVSNLVSILCNESENFDDADKLIYSLLNNSLDVRVIDFVRRDSHHLGTISGDSFQIDEVLPHVTVHKHELALKVHGVSVAEQIILLRYWLFSRVYWNSPNRTFCAMARVLFLKLHEFPEFVSDFRTRVLKFDQRSMVEFLNRKCEELSLPRYKELAYRLSGEEDNLYKLIFETSKINKELEGHFYKLADLKNEQLNLLADNVFNGLLQANLVGKADGIIPVIVDYPVEPGSTKMGQDVQVRINHRQFKPLLDVSGIIMGVNSSFDEQLSKFRVFIHPDLKPPKEKRQEFQTAVQVSTVEFLKTL